MKKTYIRPLMEVEAEEPETMICGSQDITGSDGYGITYGGVDEEGTMDPASRRRDVWEEEDEGF